MINNEMDDNNKIIDLSINDTSDENILEAVALNEEDVSKEFSEPSVVGEYIEADKDSTEAIFEIPSKTRQRSHSKNTNKASKKKEKDASKLQDDEEEQYYEPKLLASSSKLKDIILGNFFELDLFKKNIKLVILIAFSLVINITLRYTVQQQLIEIDRLNTILKDAKYKALASSSELTEETRESHVLNLLKSRRDSTMKRSSQPPFIINVPE